MNGSGERESIEDSTERTLSAAEKSRNHVIMSLFGNLTEDFQLRAIRAVRAVYAIQKHEQEQERKARIEAAKAAEQAEKLRKERILNDQVFRR